MGPPPSKPPERSGDESIRIVSKLEPPTGLKRSDQSHPDYLIRKVRKVDAENKALPPLVPISKSDFDRAVAFWNTDQTDATVASSRIIGGVQILVCNGSMARLRPSYRYGTTDYVNDEIVNASLGLAMSTAYEAHRVSKSHQDWVKPRNSIVVNTNVVDLIRGGDQGCSKAILGMKTQMDRHGNALNVDAIEFACHYRDVPPANRTKKPEPPPRSDHFTLIAVDLVERKWFVADSANGGYFDRDYAKDDIARFAVFLKDMQEKYLPNKKFYIAHQDREFAEMERANDPRLVDPNDWPIERVIFGERIVNSNVCGLVVCHVAALYLLRLPCDLGNCDFDILRERLTIAILNKKLESHYEDERCD
jgi:hypothetical protein